MNPLLKLVLGKRPRIPKQLKGPNATEERFRLNVLRCMGTYEPCRFTITGNKRRKYTPDFLYIHHGTDGDAEVYIEVKGSYKLPSEDRARLAWELTAEANPDKVFVWARDAGYNYKWRVEVWADGGRRKACNHVICHRDFNELLVKLLG